MITTNVSEEVQQMNQRAHPLKVQEAYRTSKGIAVKRFIHREQSPSRQIYVTDVTEHFAKTWAEPENNFREVEQGVPFDLEPQITENDQEEMEAFMLDERNIEEVIKSRQDLSASGTDGLSHRIIKAAGKEGVKFIKLLVRACIKNGKMIKTWKEPRTILIQKKGDRGEIQNWRPISITNCIYRIFTCSMARATQATNSKADIYSDNQKGFIKKTNDCRKQGIILNELLHDANRNKQSLVATASDFTNAFGSVPHELIMSMMKQRNFSTWMQEIVRSMYQGSTSVVELGETRSENIPRKRVVKQGCPLSP
jgi:hypothetical protein